MKKSQLTRQRIIKISAELFNQKGYEGTSIQNILTNTGLTKGGLYGHFNNKEEIAVAAFKFAVDTVKMEVAKRTHIIESIPDKLKAVVYFYKENLFTPPIEGGCPILNTSIEADDNNPVLREKVIEALDYWQERIIRTLRKGMELNQIKDDVNVKEFASLFISTLEGGIMLSRLYKDQKHFDIISKQLIRMVEDAKKINQTV